MQRDEIRPIRAGSMIRVLPRLIVVAGAFFLSTAMQLHGQASADAQQAEAIRKLQDTMNQLRTQMEGIQGQLDAMRHLSGSPPASSNATITRSTEAAAAAMPTLSTGTAGVDKQTVSVGKQTSSYETFNEDPFAAPRLNNVPLDPIFSGYFVLPGTQTLLRIGGYFKTDFLYDLRPAGNPEQFIVSTIPTPTVDNTRNSTLSIRGSRFTLDFRIPESRAGDVRMYLEADEFGTDDYTPRLRHAYAQVKNILVGQTFSNFMDPDAWPDTVDYHGPNAGITLRNPQVRYGFAVGRNTSVFVSVEKPNTDIAFTYTVTPVAISPAPDVSVRLRYEGNRGHVQLASVFRDLAINLPSSHQQSVLGWGVSAAGNVRTFGRDNVTYQLAYGHGISKYVGDTSGLGLDAAFRSPTDTSLRSLPIFAPFVGYQHYWSKSVRSTSSFGFVQLTNTPFQPAATFHKDTYSSVNLIWNAIGSLNVGAEFLYGSKETQGGTRVNAPRFQISGKYNFVRVKKEAK